MNVQKFFSQTGPLSQQFSDYETREGQIALSEKIHTVLEDGGVGLFEAGTGVGKSLAYLYPAYLKSRISNKPVVISTTTNNLLSQLLYKDLPLLQQVLKHDGEDITYIGLKGKSHYACQAKMEGNIDPSVNELIKDIENTEHGERNEVGYQVYEDNWRKIAYDRESCTGVQCPFYKECYIVNLKKKAEKANVIVTNHNIIFAEKLAKFSILPDYEDLIIDEGHNIESVATDYLTDSISLTMITSLAWDLHKQETSRTSGISTFPKLRDYADRLAKISTSLIAAKFEIEDYIEELPVNDVDDFTVINRDELFEKLNVLTPILNEVFEILEGIELPNATQAFHVSSALNSATLLRHWIKSIEDPTLVIWGKKKLDDAFLHQTPLNIGQLLQKELYHSMNSVNIVSATLTVNRKFDYSKNRLGLDIKSNNPDHKDINISEEVFVSPFNYKDQMKIFIRRDIPDQRAPEYVSRLADGILHSLKKTNGNCFVLFTSYSTMMNCADILKEPLETLSIPLLVQQSGNREEIIGRFKEGGAVLFGVESFWEGVDIPGEALSQVIITKLPFKVPSTPIEKARAEEVEKNGGNSFMNLSLPQAVIKFRQGIGRLIRTKSDTGIITILDSRVVNSGYGKVFLDSIR